MKHILFCCLMLALMAGCLVRVQSQRSNSNTVGNAVNRLPGSSNVRWVNTNPFNWNAANPTFDGTPVKRVLHKQYASKKRLYDVCGDPRLRCVTSGKFRPEDLPIKISGDLELFGSYKSKPFFAIVLDSRDPDPEDEACAKRFSEDDRIEAQKLFVNNKVFTSAAGCPNFEGVYEYKYISDIPGVHMLAVYGGATEFRQKPC